MTIGQWEGWTDGASAVHLFVLDWTEFPIALVPTDPYRVIETRVSFNLDYNGQVPMVTFTHLVEAI